MIHLRKSAERGHADHGWLDSHHTFSFAEYHDPEHMGFRSLRVINEDRVAGGGGFPTHPHRDMEIISYVVSGALEHRDSTGGHGVLETGDLQHISAGTGVSHSEFNHSRKESVHFLQIWILPERKGLPPSYGQISVREKAKPLVLAASQDGGNGALKINQDAAIFVGRLSAGEAVEHALTNGRHAWVQLISGSLSVNGTELAAGDGAAISEEASLRLNAGEASHFLLFDLA